MLPTKEFLDGHNWGSEITTDDEETVKKAIRAYEKYVSDGSFDLEASRIGLIGPSEYANMQYEIMCHKSDIETDQECTITYWWPKPDTQVA